MYKPPISPITPITPITPIAKKPDHSKVVGLKVSNNIY